MADEMLRKTRRFSNNRGPLSAALILALTLSWANPAQPQGATRNITFVKPANTPKLDKANDAGVAIEIKPADEIL